MATLVRTPEGFFQQGQAGLIPITDPVQLRDLNAGNTPYVNETSAPQVASPTVTQSSVPQKASLPLPGPATGTTTTPAGGDPYTIFNQNIASILTQIQNAQTAGRANLSGAKDALTTSSVTSAPYDPTMAPDANNKNMTGTQGAFQPAISSVNTQLENADSALSGLKGDISGMASIFQPQSVAPGSSLVTPSGQVVKQGHQYQPQMNPNTGLLDGFDITTGTWASSDQSTGQGKGNTVVGGVDFSGAATSTQPYATDPNYASEVGNIYKTLATTTPQPTPDTIDAYIKAHAKSSPVSGVMILNAASQYGVDANLLTSVLAQESDFGTAGAGAKTQNPGNVGNTDNGGTHTYNSWQQGVNAAASELAKRKVPGNTQTPQTQQPTQSNVGGQFSTTAATKVAQIPGPMQSYVDAGPKGVAYINDDRVPANLKDTLKIMASRAGVPYLASADAQAIKSIGVVYQSLDGMTSLVNDQLHSGFLGGTWDILKTGIHDASFGNVFPELSKFNAYRDTAIKAVQGLAGGAGSGLRINSAEIEASLTSLAGSSDTIANATNKISGITAQLDKQLAATFPYIQTDKAPGGSAGGNSGVTPSGIKYTVTK